MLLNELFENAPEIEIENITSDSRSKKKNSIFFCIKGMVFDGHKYYKQSIANGAVVIVHSHSIDTTVKNVVFIKVPNVVEALGRVSDKFYHYPSKQLFMYGVTGTNGKSSVTSLIKKLLNNYKKCGYIGTISIEYNDLKLPPLLTTPTVLDLQYYLSEMVDAGMDSCALEVSSIGIEQKRVNNIDFDIAIFTNLTHDHMDYHGSMSAYFNAKKQFFDSMKIEGIVITNVDDQYGLEIVENTKAKVYTYGIDNEADYRAKDIDLQAKQTIFTLECKEGDFRLKTNLVAKFNVYNLLATIAALRLSGIEMSQIISSLDTLGHIEGRMHLIEENQPFNIIVDFAHTPDGIEKVFQYASEITSPKNRIIAVFGSAGKRDIKKRVIFGELADKYCDMVILTEDDPRDEDVEDIANQIASGIKNTNYTIVLDRYNAIRQAIDIANINDTILILGKGDEQFMYRVYGREPYIGDHKACIEILEKFYLEEEKEDEKTK